MLSLYTKLKSLGWGTIEKLHPELHRMVYAYRIYVKYLISGGSAAVVNLTSLLLLVELLHVHYILGSILAFFLGFVASFVFQKFFTFGDTVMHMVHRQLILYLGIALGNLFLNTFLVYIFVDVFHVWYLLSQAIASILIAITSFVLYRKFVFTRSYISHA